MASHKQTSKEGSETQHLRIHPMFARSRVLNNSSTAQQPLRAETNSSSDNDDAMVIGDTDLDPENLNNEAHDQLTNDEPMVIITDNENLTPNDHAGHSNCNAGKTSKSRKRKAAVGKKAISKKTKAKQPTSSLIKKYTFRKQWLDEPELKSWLEERPIPRTIEEQRNNKLPSSGAWCIPCGRFICFTSVNDLKKHSNNDRHLENTATHPQRQKEAEELDRMLGSSTQKKVATHVARIVAFVAENYLPINIVDKLVRLQKKLSPGDKYVNQISLGRTKAGSVIRQAFGKYLSTALIDKLRTTLFSISADETTDLSTEKKLAIVVQFYDFVEHKKLVVDILELVECLDGTAKSIFSALFDLLEKIGCKKNLVGFSADTCNTMFGKNNSVAKYLRERIPGILVVKCACHGIHLSACKASNVLPNCLEELLHYSYNHFARSPKRRTEFFEFQEYAKAELLNLLRPSDTRWLTVQASVKRILSQLDALRLYFVHLKSEDMYKENESLDNVIITLCDPLTIAFLEFADYGLGLMNDFNTTFQAESPLIHLHKQSFEKLISTLAINFMEPNYVRESDSTSIDAHDELNYVPLRDVYPGPAAYETIQNLRKSKELSVKLEYPSPLFNSGLQEVGDQQSFDEISSGQIETPILLPPACGISGSELGVSQEMRIDSFYTYCRKFYICAISDMISRFDFSDPVYEVVFMIHPENARNLKPRTLSALFERFPVLINFCDRKEAEKEWKAHALLPTSSFGVLTESAVFCLSAEDYWHKVFANHETAFVNLRVCVSMLFSLIVSNVIAERKFSELNNIKTDRRTSLDDETIVGLMRIKAWLKAHGKSADDVDITDELVQAVIKVKANATISHSRSV